MSLGIDFGIIGESFLGLFLCFVAIVFWCFWKWYLFRCCEISDPKMDATTFAAGLAASGLPPRFPCTSVSLTCVRPTSVISRVFLISKFSSRFSYTIVCIAKVKAKIVLWPETPKKDRREALDSDSSKDLFGSNFYLFWYLFVTFIVFPKSCCSFGFDVALFSQTVCANWKSS